MGIRSLTIVLGEDGGEICVLRRDLDGQLTGHSVDLRNFLRGYVLHKKKLSGSGRENRTVLSMGRLAATLVADFKSGIGDFTLLPSGTRNVGEEYIYAVYARPPITKSPSLLSLRVQVPTAASALATERNEQDWRVVYDGLLDEFDPGLLDMQWDETGEAVADFVDRRMPLNKTARSA